MLLAEDCTQCPNINTHAREGKINQVTKDVNCSGGSEENR